MSLYQCEHCGCCENTATGGVAHRGEWYANLFDWTGIEDRRGKLLCSACGPAKFSDGTEIDNAGQWHGRFPRTFLPMGMFQTAKNGNLEHIETGDQDIRKYAIQGESNEH